MGWRRGKLGDFNEEVEVWMKKEWFANMEEEDHDDEEEDEDEQLMI